MADFGEFWPKYPHISEMFQNIKKIVDKVFLPPSGQGVENVSAFNHAFWQILSEKDGILENYVFV